jgi:hypothetical protein
MLKDLELSKDQSGKYSLIGTTTDLKKRIISRFDVQLLSQEKLNSSRGSLFSTELARGNVSTFADINALFALSTKQVIENMREYAEEISPEFVVLIDREFLDGKKVSLTFEIFTKEQTVINNVIAG